MSEDKPKPPFDEQALDRLLEAAYVLQEHNRRLEEMQLRVEPPQELNEPPSPAPLASPDQQAGHPESEENSVPSPDYTYTLGQIVEVQHQIQLRRLELNEAMSLVATQVRELARANGSAIGILDNKEVKYRAAAGDMTLASNTAVPMEKALCVASLRTGQVIRCPDVAIEFLLDAEECHRRGIQSMIAVPIYHDGGIAGGLELYYGRPQGFSEQDVHTCQLMAGLVTEALARDEEESWKKSLATERAIMQEAFDRIRPVAQSQAPNLDASAEAPASFCPKCGNGILADEQFCGKCGAPRGQGEAAAVISRNSDIQTTESRQNPLKERPSDFTEELRGGNESLSDFLTPLNSSLDHTDAPLQSPDLSLPDQTTPPLSLARVDLVERNLTEHSIAESAEGTKLDQIVDWSSAASARDYLEHLAPEPSGALARFWAARRGDIYLAIAVILVAGVIRWGIWSDHSVTATASSPSAVHRNPAPDADLSLFDRLLIKLGLAEPPETPESKGNPDTQVWVDLQTALYYCPGADLYGKTPKGRFSSQRDAQLDSFEPAGRKACN